MKLAPSDTGACGEYRGAMRHRRRGENYCEPCRAATAAYDSARKTSQRRPRTNLAPCGTRAARRRHKDHNETCTTCGPINPRPEPQPCGTPAAYQRHKRHGETPCEPCRTAYRQADAAKRRKPTTTPRSETNLNELLTEIRFLLNAGEGEHRLLTATVYQRRAKTLRCRLTKAGQHDLANQIFYNWELAA
jgi:hypothetical protein